MEIDEIYKKYKEANVNYETTNPETEPFKFKYKAKEILESLLTECESEESCQIENIVNLRGALAYFIAKINYETEDRVAAERNFEKTLKILENEKFDSVSSICYMKLRCTMYLEYIRVQNI